MDILDSKIKINGIFEYKEIILNISQKYVIYLLQEVLVDNSLVEVADRVDNQELKLILLESGLQWQEKNFVVVEVPGT